MVTALGPTPTSAAMTSVQGAAQALRTQTALPAGSSMTVEPVYASVHSLLSTTS